MPRDPARCRHRIYSGGWGPPRQCSRRPVRHGYCLQHHPDTAAERERARAAKWEAESRAREIAETERAVALLVAKGYHVFTPGAWALHRRDIYDCGGTECGHTCQCEGPPPPEPEKGSTP